MRIGVISDTHGLLRPEALAALRGADHIFHAGDVGNASILDALRTLAPVTAVRGNIDRTGACARLPATEFIEFGGVSLYLLHNLAELDLNPAAAGVAAVISGHTHKPMSETRNGVLYFNPGSSGPQRFSLPTSIGLLDVTGTTIAPRIHLLSCGGPQRL